jgi:hypothetical protein
MVFVFVRCYLLADGPELFHDNHLWRINEDGKVVELPLELLVITENSGRTLEPRSANWCKLTAGDVLQIRSSKQDRTDLFYSKAFIYGYFSDVALDPNSSKTVFATHPFRMRI